MVGKESRMICPECGGKTRVLDTRFNDEHNEIYRRRTCPICNHIFFTMEFEADYTLAFAKSYTATFKNRDKRVRKENNQ